MPIKPGAVSFELKEQIIEIPGLTLQFRWVDDDPEAPIRLVLVGEALPLGNYEILFSQQGAMAGGGMSTTGHCTPSWLSEVR